MSFTVRLDGIKQPAILRAYLQSLEVTSLMNQHAHHSVMATRERLKVSETKTEEFWCIGPIDGEPIYTLQESTIRGDRLHDFLPTLIDPRLRVKSTK